MANQRKLWVMVAAAGVTVAIVLATVVGFNRETTPTGLAATADSGSAYRDFSFSADNVRDPTANTSQSKLWFNDGTWWGILFDRSTGKYNIHRYNWDTHTWIDTGTGVDERNSPKADALWDGTYLYVVSAGPASTISNQSARILRYSYDALAESYSLDPGFPVTITSGGMKAIVLEKDTTGKLWVTYVQDGQVYVSHTLNNDLTWAEPFVLPVQGTTVAPEDISAIIAFDSQIGVMWSNQTRGAFYFTTHKDGDDDDAWQASTALWGASTDSQELSSIADNNINLKADSSGRVYAAVQTSFRAARNSASHNPLNVLLVRSQDGNWVSHVFDKRSDKHTRPIVLIDEENRDLYMFASCCGYGQIYYKKTSLDDISFPEGQGTPFIQSATDTHINDVTSTKQNLDGVTGLLALASDKTSGYYLHNVIDLN